jgi:hypothetical protein
VVPPVPTEGITDNCTGGEGETETYGHSLVGQTYISTSISSPDPDLTKRSLICSVIYELFKSFFKLFKSDPSARSSNIYLLHKFAPITLLYRGLTRLTSPSAIRIPPPTSNPSKPLCWKETEGSPKKSKLCYRRQHIQQSKARVSVRCPSSRLQNTHTIEHQLIRWNRHSLVPKGRSNLFLILGQGS